MGNDFWVEDHCDGEGGRERGTRVWAGRAIPNSDLASEAVPISWCQEFETFLFTMMNIFVS